jgi:glycosyltransferase involved in cell wall biosynthesis
LSGLPRLSHYRFRRPTNSLGIALASADIIEFELAYDCPEAVSPIRVAHIITDLEPAGAEHMLLRLVEGAPRTHIEHAVISLTTRGPFGDRIAQAGIPVFALGMRPGRPDPRALWRLVRLLRRLRPAIVQTWLYHADFAGLLAGKLAGVPVVWNIRCAELDPRDHPASLMTLLRALTLASRYPAAVICNSHAGQRAHERLGYAPRRWAVIPNGFDVDTFRPFPEAPIALRRELDLPADAKLIGLLARFHPMKDHATFLRAAKIVIDAKPDVHFVAAGRGVDAALSLNALLDELVLRSRVSLLPERRDTFEFLAGLDTAISSSYSEGFPNVIGEAMACGTPCVVTDVGDSAEIVRDTGVIVPPRNPAALAAGIVRVLELDDAAREALGRAARARIIAEFSIERIAAQYEALYSELTGRHMKSPEPMVCAE